MGNLCCTPRSNKERTNKGLKKSFTAPVKQESGDSTSISKDELKLLSDFSHFDEVRNNVIHKQRIYKEQKVSEVFKEEDPKILKRKMTSDLENHTRNKPKLKKVPLHSKSPTTNRKGRGTAASPILLQKSETQEISS